jgi:hypothetical protein
MPLIPSGFPEYKFHEYPKWVTPANGVPVIAEHAQHEAELMGKKPVAASPAVSTEDEKAAAEAAAAELKFEQDAEREFLFKECISRGIKVHPKSGIAKLKAALA